MSHSSNNSSDDQYTQELISAPKEKSKRINTRELKDSAAVHAKSQPLITRLPEPKGERKAYSELIINSEPLEKRVALMKDGVRKFEIERRESARGRRNFQGTHPKFGTRLKSCLRGYRRGKKCFFALLGHSTCSQ